MVSNGPPKVNQNSQIGTQATINILATLSVCKASTRFNIIVLRENVINLAWVRNWQELVKRVDSNSTFGAAS